MPQIPIRYLYWIMTLIVVTIFQSCTIEPLQEDNSGSNGNLKIKLSTKSLELSGKNANKVRLIVYHRNESRIRLNATNLTDQSVEPGEGLFVISVPPGDYSFYAIVNEPDNLTAQLDQISTPEQLNAIIIQPADPFTETTVMLAKKVDAVIATASNGNTTVNGSASQLLIELERVYTKVSLKINKQTLNPADKFTIKKVDFVQSPAYSSLNAKVYDGTTFISKELFDGSIEFITNGQEDVIIKAITDGTSAEPSNIFAEYLLTDEDKSRHDKASYFGILATYTAAGNAPQDVYYKIPVGDYNGSNAVDGTGHDYNLKRNHHYNLNVKITKMGEKDAVEILYSVKPWTSEFVDIEIDGDPFLDVSNVEVDVYDAAATRIYFYSNMPVILDPMLLNGTQSVAVNDLFENLAGMGANNFTYTYDSTNQRGEGYLDLINTHTDNPVISKRLLYLKAGKLVRTIAATTRVSGEMAKQNTQPYIGTFHRTTERGERIISWYLPATTRWKIEVEEPLDGAQLRIDRLASPNHSKLYTLDPPNAEGAFVANTVTRIEGQGRIYFRVGWASTIPYSSHRYAKIKVSTSTDNFATQTVSYLYSRQGEEPQAITPGATLFSCYNVSTPEQFVDYPTKSGYLYQWNRTQPWAATGIVNNYPKGDASDQTQNNGYLYSQYNDQTYVCPAKYAYPDATAVTVIDNALTNTSRQWGYYADGFFDRRAVTNHGVRSISGGTASAGVMLYSPTTGISIFMPTAAWRNYNGEINSDSGITGHYWSIPQKGEWNPTNTLGTATLEAISIRFSHNGSVIDPLNKASAASVRCMRLEGLTIYFDANGGLSAPRTITQAANSTFTFPAGPAHQNPILVFDKWAETRSGSGTTYLAGATGTIGNTDNKIYYAQYKKLYLIDGNKFDLTEMNYANTGTVLWAEANANCTALNTGGTTGWTLPTAAQLTALYAIDAKLFVSKSTWFFTNDTEKAWSSELGENLVKTKLNYRCIRKTN